jgi:hypothetical protein
LEQSLVIAGVGMFVAAGIAARTLGSRRESAGESPFEF